jgi:hypothetical protein
MPPGLTVRPGPFDRLGNPCCGSKTQVAEPVEATGGARNPSAPARVPEGGPTEWMPTEGAAWRCESEWSVADSWRG